MFPVSLTSWILYLLTQIDTKLIFRIQDVQDYYGQNKEIVREYFYTYHTREVNCIQTISIIPVECGKYEGVRQSKYTEMGKNGQTNHFKEALPSYEFESLWHQSNETFL